VLGVAPAGPYTWPTARAPCSCLVPQATAQGRPQEATASSCAGSRQQAERSQQPPGSTVPLLAEGEAKLCSRRPAGPVSLKNAPVVMIEFTIE
jgi:hypothetical protein